MPAKPLNQLSGMPQMGAAFAGWTKSITLERVTQTIVNGFAQDTLVPWTFAGTVQPLGPKSIALKPEGQRAFKWLQIHQITRGVAGDLTTNDKILYNGTLFKVMAVLDYSLNNYVEYHLVEDFQ